MYVHGAAPTVLSQVWCVTLCDSSRCALCLQQDSRTLDSPAEVLPRAPSASAWIKQALLNLCCSRKGKASQQLKGKTWEITLRRGGVKTRDSLGKGGGVIYGRVFPCAEEIWQTWGRILAEDMEKGLVESWVFSDWQLICCEFPKWAVGCGKICKKIYTSLGFWVNLKFIFRRGSCALDSWFYLFRIWLLVKCDL